MLDFGGGNGRKKTSSKKTSPKTRPNAKKFVTSKKSSSPRANDRVKPGPVPKGDSGAAAAAAQRRAEEYAAAQKRAWEAQQRRAAQEKAEKEKKAKTDKMELKKKQGTGELLQLPGTEPGKTPMSKPANPAKYGNNPLLGGGGKEVKIVESDPTQKIDRYVDNDGKVRSGEQSALVDPNPETRKVATNKDLGRVGVGDPTKKGPTDLPMRDSNEEVDVLQKKRAEKKQRTTLEEALRKARKSADFDGKFKPMTERRYNRLSDREKAAIDFNSVMEQAYKRDNRDQKEMGGVDKKYTLDEAPKEIQEKYRKRYEKIFGNGYDDNEIVVAPKTLGVLDRVLGVDKRTAGLGEYLEGGGFITDEDLKSGVLDQKKPRDERAKWLNTLVDYQEEFNKVLEKGRVTIEGVRNKVNILDATDAGLADLVNQAAQPTKNPDNIDLLALRGKGDPRFGNQLGLDLSGLASSNQLSEINDLRNASAMLQDTSINPDFTPDLLTNKKFLTDVAKNNGLNPKKWRQLINAQLKSQKKSEQESEVKNLTGG